jgi:CO dehydrogenase nickel-insertion accessory protein CooC1
MTESKVLAGKHIGVFGKGGAGKSTVVVLLAHALRDHGYEVCVLDADSTNLGLHQAFGLDESPRSLLDYFGGMVFSGGRVTCPVDDPTPLPEAEISLVQLPDEYVGRNREGIVLLTAGKIGEQGPGAGCDGPISKIARDLRIRSDTDAPITLIDFKAGFEDAARGTVTSLDWAVAVVDPTTAGMQMVIHMKNMIDRIKAGELPATGHLENLGLVEMANRIFREASIKDMFVMLNRIPARETEEYMRRYLGMRNIEPIGVLHEHACIALSWLKGTPLEDTNARGEVDRIVERLETVAGKGRS